MSEEKITIKVPEGYEARWNSEHTEVEIVKKEEAALTYKNICDVLFGDESTSNYYTNYGEVIKGELRGDTKYLHNAATSEIQIKKMLAYNKLMNIATYLNNGWKPDWEDTRQIKYYIVYSNENIKGEYRVFNTGCYNQGVVYFKTAELAKQAMDIMDNDLNTLFKN